MMSAPESAAVVGVFRVPVFGVDGPVEEAAPRFLFCGVGERCAERAPYVCPLEEEGAGPSRLSCLGVTHPVLFAVGSYVTGVVVCEVDGDFVYG